MRAPARRLVCILTVTLMATLGGRGIVAAEQAGDAGQSCRKYLPSVGKTVEVPCERAPAAERGVSNTLPLERLSLRTTLGKFTGDSPIARGSLGVRISDLLPSLAKLTELTNAKVFTNEVMPQSPAEIAGFRPGDIILSIDGLAPKDPSAFRDIVQSHAPGSEVTLEIARVGEGGDDLIQSLRERADAGSMDATIALAVLMRIGVGSVKSDAEAARWYRKAAELGNADAMYNLGTLYQGGLGLVQDDAEAARWFQKAAELGDVNAMNALSDLYQTGRGVAKNEAEAARWKQRAVDAAK